MQVTEVKVKEVYRVECKCGYKVEVKPYDSNIVGEAEYKEARKYFHNHVFNKNYFDCTLKLVKEEQN